MQRTPANRLQNRSSSLVSSAAIAWALANAAPAHAQVENFSEAQARYINADANGVDVNDGSFNFSIVEGSIGSGEGALSIVRNYGRLGPSDNLPSRLVRATVNGQRRIRLQFGNTTASFTDTGGSLVPDNADGSALIQGSNGASYTYVDRDGTRISYTSQPVSVNASITSDAPRQCADLSGALCYLQPTEVIRPSGMKTVYTWKTGVFCQSTNSVNGNTQGYGCILNARIERVQTDAGYVMAIGYTLNPSSSGTHNISGPGWTERAQIVFSNVNLTTSSYPRTTYQTVYSSTGDITETVQDTANREWRFTRRSTGELVTVRRPGSTVDTTVVTRNGAGDITSVLHDGVTTNYSRVPNGTLVTTTVTNALSQTTTIVSDTALSRPRQVTDALNRTTTYQYDAAARLTLATMPEGNAVRTDYDARGNALVVTAISKPGSGLADIVSRAEYASTCTNPVTCNNPTATVDARLGRTEYTYDNVTGLPLTITAPAVGGVSPRTTLTYGTVNGVAVLSSASTCRTQTSCPGSADEVKTTYQYNSNLQPTLISTGAGDGSLTASEGYTYDYRGNLLTVDGPLPGTADTTSFRYDAARQLVGVVSPDPDGTGSRPNPAQAIFYNRDGTVAEVRQGTTAGQSDSAWSAFTSATELVSRYDGNGRKISDRLNVRTSDTTFSSYGLTHYSYDALGRPDCSAVRMTPGSWNSGTTNACVLQTQGSFGPDRITRWSYDAAGQPTSTVTGFGSSQPITASVFAHTLNGKVQTAKDANGNLTTYTYDGHDRLARTQYPNAANGASSSASDFETAAYDPAGNVTELTLRGGQVMRFTYDALNRPTFKDVGAATMNTSYGYDLAGNPLYARSSNDSGLGVTNTYDALGRVTQTVDNTSGASRVLGYAYDLAGRRTQMTYPDGYILDYRVDTNGAVTLLSTPSLAPTPDLVAFTYDNQGRLTRVGRGKGAGGITLYGYDPIGRLTTLSHDLFAGRTDAGADTNDVSYTMRYNPAFPNFQITGVDTSNSLYLATESTFTSTSSINGLNQLNTKGQQSYGHDARGNLTTVSSTSTGAVSTAYSYDLEGHLLTAQNSNGTMYRYGYDPVGRLARAELDGAPSSLVQFLYDGDDLVAEYDATGTMIRRYVHGAGIDQPLLEERDPSSARIRQNLFPDLRGSIVAVGWLEGGLQARVNKYDPDGFEGASNGNPWSNVGRFGYTGQIRLPEVGLAHFKARTYAPRLGRFLQPDPIGYEDGMNLYGYVGGDPLNYTDPSGTQTSASLIGFSSAPVDIGTLRAQITSFGPNDILITATRLSASWTWSTVDFSRWADRVQTGLDLAGLVPGFGEPADLLNAAIYSLRGDWTNAGLSVAAVVPVVGSAATATKFLASPGRVQHAFRRGAENHLSPVTEASRRRVANLFANVAGNPRNVDSTVLRGHQLTSPGFVGYSQQFNNGRVWVQTRNGDIMNGGVSPR